MAEFTDTDLRSARFENVDLGGASFCGVNPSDGPVPRGVGRRRPAVGRDARHPLAPDTEPVEGPSWLESRSYPVRECLSVVLNEEWQHRLSAERDLTALESTRR